MLLKILAYALLMILLVSLVKSFFKNLRPEKSKKTNEEKDISATAKIIDEKWLDKDV